MTNRSVSFDVACDSPYIYKALASLRKFEFETTHTSHRTTALQFAHHETMETSTSSPLTQYNTMDSPPHNLGVLVNLPPEIRAKIWENLRPKAASPALNSTQPAIKNSLGILRACHQLYQEIMPHLYDDTLNIYIESTWSKFLKIVNSQGATVSGASPASEIPSTTPFAISHTRSSRV